VYTITATTPDALAISSGSVEADDIYGTEFRVDISGSGDVDAEGTLSGLLSVSISGSGEFDGESLTAPEGQVEVSGSGSAFVNVADTLEVSVSGSGDVGMSASQMSTATSAGRGPSTSGSDPLEVGAQVPKLLAKDAAGQQRVEPSRGARWTEEGGPRHLSDAGSVSVRLDRQTDDPPLEPIVGLPSDGAVPHLDDLDIDVELHSSRAGSI
jgi:Putative auto-transporter adhesin, head GIN domain